ncbi:cell division protein ZapD [Lampropedia hyalina DSM 16112]|uniref:Cell division protein ZapD n=1 Tax=Lampropedia hyalina DSM 16112 TaxID=1122156 RepID=A0A1M5E2T3_9BURK|nr:cell division protein ZapD [Lampropedia hyalina]SHF73496.1 cell division protein ZapD [Lampropedia hyalina DSM 16112]
MILYEYPFNERIRVYLRLEYLLQRLQLLLERSNPIDHHYALQTLFETAEVAARADLKAGLFKDLERHKSILQPYLDNPEADQAVLERIIGKIDACVDGLTAMPGKPGQEILDNEWLTAVRNRMAISGGTGTFDLPFYHYWQNLAATTRLQNLEEWTSSLVVLADTVFLLLKLVRDSGNTRRVAAHNGQFQQNLPANRNFQLLRLWLQPGIAVVPEISVNQLLVSVRFLEPRDNAKPLPCHIDLSLDVAICV